MMRLALVGMSLFIILGSVRANEPGDEATIAYIVKLQDSGGGFLPFAPKPNEKVKLQPTVRATLAAVRALHYFKGTLPNKEGCAKFIDSCHNSISGGFADIPHGQADVFTTSIGMMAVLDLKMPEEKYMPGAVKYLTENVKNIEEVRIAAAGHESLAKKSSKTKEWLEIIRKLGNDDGTFSKGAEQARATGGAVVAMLRLGGKIDKRDVILQTLRDGQRRNGGFGKDSDIDADLGSCYRIMRCFHMLKAQPKDVEGMRSFIAKCRNDDGGYALTPGGPSSLEATYYAAIIRYWLAK